MNDDAGRNGRERAERQITEAKRTGATEVDFSYLGLAELPVCIFDLTNLTTLILANNRLTTLPKRIEELTTITTLNLSNNYLTTLPEHIAHLTALTTLNVAHNKLRTLPENIGDLTALTTLDLSYNYLTNLPERIFNLTALTILDLGNNELTILPECIGNLAALTTLELRQNRLTTLPECIGDLTTLRLLELTSNDLITLPERIGDLSALTMLNMTLNHLTSLPESIGGLTALTSLHLRGNKLTTLPERIGDLAALTELNLPQNKLVTLPERIGDLAALILLNLAENKLTTLPERIGDLTALTTLYLGNNDLTSLPERISDLTSVTKLNLWNNPLVNPPAKIAEMGLPSIRRYFYLRNMDGNWVGVSTLESRALNRPSIFAVGETLVCTSLLLAAITQGMDWPLVAGAAVTPLLLMRTPQSTLCGVNRLANLGRRLGLRSQRYRRRPLLLAAALMMLGIGSLLIKIVTTLQFSWRWSSIFAIPQNFNHLVTRIDYRSPPELVPGAEEAYHTHRDGIVTLSDLRLNFTADIKDYGSFWLGGLSVERGSLWTSIIGFTCLGGFFLFAWIYRFSLKASCLIYWPFLLVNRYDDDAQMERDATRNSGGNWLKSSIGVSAMIGLGMLSLFELVRLAGFENWETLLTELMPSWARTAATKIAPILWPKLLLTSLLVMSLSYLLNRLAHGGMHRSHTITGHYERSDFKFWRNMFKLAVTTQNIALTVATTLLLTWAWPKLIEHLGSIWHFLF